MTRWRVMVCVIVILAVLLIGLDALFPTHPSLLGPRFSRGVGEAGVPGFRGNPFMGPIPVRPATLMVGYLGSLVAEFLFAMVVMYLLPRQIQFMANDARGGLRRLLRYLALGLALVVLLGAVGLLSALSLRTFPLPFIVLGLLFLVASVGVIALTLAMGRGLLQRAGWYDQRPLLGLALGTLILSAVALIPFVGDILLVLVLLTGAGIAVATHFGTGTPWTLKALVEEVGK